jgi:hypothetical protein
MQLPVVFCGDVEEYWCVVVMFVLVNGNVLADIMIGGLKGNG